MKTELLAPAKNLETGKAAIDAGADAVYIGANSFGARHNACNSLKDIKELVDYAHKFYVKVMVTVNTILYDSELETVKKLITDLYEIGVDSIIIQDMAIIKWAIDGEIPPIPLHISTQCDNRFDKKISFNNRLGINRVVLARELSLEQIKEIIINNPNIEIETFVHGALCVSYSGQCYLSNHIGGRSANRGECAQPCRKKYSVIDENGNILIKDKHVLSLKDFNASGYVNKLVDIGVKSFKVEGRLKDINYVKNVVGFYRQELDKYSKKTSSGKIELNFVPDLNKTFNRGFTTYFLNKRENCFNFNTPKFIGEKIGTVSEIRKDSFNINFEKNISLNKQDGLVFDETGEIGCFVNNVINNTIYPNKLPKNLKKGMSVYRNIDSEFEKQLTNSKAKRSIGVKIKYENNVLYATDEDNNEVSVKITEFEPAKNSSKMVTTFVSCLQKTGNSDFYISDKIDILSDVPFIPISKCNEYRRILFDLLMEKRLSNYRREVQKPLKYTEYCDKEIYYNGNVLNKDSEKFYNMCGAKVCEYAPESDKNNRSIELMRTKHCIKYALNMCKSDKKLYLVDDYGKKYTLKFDCKNCEMIISPQ